jgi:endonuclease/exonuclease/phosphatase family metal-dependent hydrolase
MRKYLLLIPLLPLLFVVACSHFEDASGIGRVGASFKCASATAPWIGVPAVSPMTVSESSDAPTLRAVTYNIHAGMGQWKSWRSSRASVERHLNVIADDIASVSPEPVDIVALNEVDFMARRSGHIDQARYLAEALHRRTGARYDVVYGRTRQRTFPGFEGGYGNAALVRHAIADNKACLFDDTVSCGVADATPTLPALRASGFLPRMMREARGVMKFTIDFHGRPLDVVVTHLEAVAMQEREAQAAHLLHRFVDPHRTTVVLGDMNTVPTSMTHTRAFATADRTHDILTSGSIADARVLYDLRLGRTDFRAWATYPAAVPLWPLDMVLGSLDLFPEHVQVLSAVDSDHRGFYVAYRLTGDEAIIQTQRLQHDAVRRQQLAQILQCDVPGSARAAKMQWLQHGTQFFTLPAAAPEAPDITASTL